MRLRPQYHFRPGPNGLRAWDVRKLITLAEALPIEAVNIEEITELDAPYWYAHGEQPTTRSIVGHMRLMNDADTAFPILLCEDGHIMDGMHRVAKRVLDGHKDVLARRFLKTPPPDFEGVSPGELPYDT
ncbi:hypothetical protein [Pontivivens insulae]|uniref:ParB/Sulfiredoxin domain-containing protein n=1 Tax=Pontivivens insulae TaxID=1639689 RepID=A0A2R8AC92_9RHOB|nr:hypothetical protein [Pontivivens insulae]RED13777.1 hypothetical protein DFR53_1119 [Pontivivens insulae]SPF29851.1 hypothetical protein POI8812_02172 [Pontivivens insulae]